MLNRFETGLAGLEQVSDDPVSDSVKFKAERPEAREQALKLEIVDTLFGPVVDGRLKELEKNKLEAEEAITALRLASAELSGTWEKDSVEGNVNRGKAFSLAVESFALANKLIDVIDYSYSVEEIRVIYEAEIYRLESIKKSCEVAIPLDRLTFEMNLAIVNETLSEEHDETELRTAMIELSAMLTKWRALISNDNPGRAGNWVDKIPALKHPLAQKLLGRLVMYGESMAGGELSSDVDSLSLVEQLVGEKIGYTSSSDYYSGQPDGQERLIMVGLQGFVDSKVPGLSSLIRKEYSHAISEYIINVGHILPEHQEQLFAGEGKFLNRGLAYEKAKARLEVSGSNQDRYRESRFNEVGQVNKWKLLKRIGWKESPLGAWVEPKQDSREVDREFAGMFELKAGADSARTLATDQERLRKMGLVEAETHAVQQQIIQLQEEYRILAAELATLELGR